MLYFRMLFSTTISLFTSRIILISLGIEDFGIYNVVGGVVIMFSFLNTSMTSATQRFLSFELGKNNNEQLNRVFIMSLNIHVLIAIFIFILAETVGIWLLNTKLTIPIERISAANWVYQFSILSFMSTVIGVPYTASIIARERMNIYAYVSIFEIILKLLIALILQWVIFDTLKLYSMLVFSVSIIIPIIYGKYSSNCFSECKYKILWDKSLFKILMNYAGWNLWGNFASVTFNQGINILLNIFFGPLINAARGIAYQVTGAVNGFVSNFQTALSPQLVKSYAIGDIKYMHQLIFQGSKYSFFLLFLLSLPILLEIKIVLHWWLKIVPDYASLFCRLVLINALIDCISGPLMMAAQATGKIKKYQLITGGLLLFILPSSYLLLKRGFPPQTTLYICILISIVSLFVRLLIISPLVNLSIKAFMFKVIMRILMVSVPASILPLIIIFHFDQGFIRFVSVCFTSIISVLISTYWFGISREERLFVNERVHEVINKFATRLKSVHKYLEF